MDVVKKGLLFLVFVSGASWGQARVKFTDGTYFNQGTVTDLKCSARVVQRGKGGKAEIPKVAFPFSKGETIQWMSLAGKSYVGKKFPPNSSLVLVFSPLTKKYYLSSKTCFGGGASSMVNKSVPAPRKAQRVQQPAPPESSGSEDSENRLYVLLGGTSFMDKVTITQGAESRKFNASSILMHLAGSYQMRMGTGTQMIFDGSVLGGLTEVGPSRDQASDPSSTLLYEVQNLPTYMFGFRPAFVWDIAKEGGYAGLGLPLYVRYQSWPSQEDGTASDVVETDGNMMWHYGISGVMALDLDPVLISCEGTFLLKPKTYVWTFALGYKM